MVERHKGTPPRRRKQLTTEDIAQIIALVDEYGAKTVGNLLIAFGYASLPKDKTIELPTEPDIEEVETN